VDNIACHTNAHSSLSFFTVGGQLTVVHLLLQLLHEKLLLEHLHLVGLQLLQLLLAVLWRLRL
jgi:hypothetical protein